MNYTPCDRVAIYVDLNDPLRRTYTAPLTSEMVAPPTHDRFTLHLIVATEDVPIRIPVTSHA